jgi:hypothetical protein
MLKSIIPSIIFCKMLKNLNKILYIALINLSLSISLIASPNFTLQDLIDIDRKSVV